MNEYYKPGLNFNCMSLCNSDRTEMFRLLMMHGEGSLMVKLLSQFPGGGGALPLEAVPDARERKRRKGVCFFRSRIAKKKGGGGGIHIVMIRALTVRLYVERVGKLRQHVH